MADGVDIPTVGPGVAKISSEEITTLNGGVVAAQQVQRLLLAFRSGEATAVDLPGDLAFGLDVDVTRLPAVELAAATLAALENITVTVANPGAGQATETTLAAVLAAVDALEANTAGLATSAAQTAAQATLAAILAELAQKLEPGGEVALNAATIAALAAAVPAAPVTGAYEQIVVNASGGAAVGLSPPGAADSALVVPSVAVRWRDDGTDPTGAAGMPLAAGQAIQFDAALGVVEFIGQAGAGVLDVTYYQNA